jgi:hypothetical protein
MILEHNCTPNNKISHPVQQRTGEQWAERLENTNFLAKVDKILLVLVF